VRTKSILEEAIRGPSPFVKIHVQGEWPTQSAGLYFLASPLNAALLADLLEPPAFFITLES
jgi:hypothetical protein